MKKNLNGFVFPARGKLKKTLLVMKLTAVFILTLLFQVNASVYSQNTKFSGDYRGKSIRQVFTTIENESRFRFFFNDDLIDIDQKVDFIVKDDNVEAILKRLFDGTDIQYKILDNGLIVVTSSPRQPSRQQKEEVSGKVTDKSGAPLPGVAIAAKETTIGTITDVDGNYHLSLKPEVKTLVFSFVGMETVEMPIGNQDVINVVMQESSIGLGEVVAVGFGIQKKESLTSAISSVGAEDLKRSQATTTSGALVGKIAGVNSRQSDGRPGSSTSIQIRNMGTPLYVIDGVQKDEGQFNNLDFNDIESISVLKDASASIYGVKAANGVVVVTTKKGRRNTKNTVNVNAYHGWQKMFKFPRPANVETYIRSYIQSDALTGNPSPKYTMEDLQKWKEGTEKGYRPWDWYDYVLITAPQDYVGVNTTGGSEKINYYLSLNHLSQKAAILNYGGFYRTNIQMNIDANITDRFKVGGSMNGRIETRKHPGVPGGDDTWQALFAIYRNLPTARPFANDNPKYPTKTSALNETNFGMLTYDQAGQYKEVWRVMQLNLDAEYEIMDGLSVKGVFGYYFASKWMDNQEYTYKLYDYDEETDTYPVIFSMDNPWRERDIRQVEEIMAQGQLTYNKMFGDHSVNAVLAAESYKRKTPGFWIHTRPESNSLHLLDYETMDEFNDDGDNTEARLGYVGRFNYNYQQKYLLEFSARYDGSWKFPPNDRWGFFPSASIGWRASEENFWKSSSVISKISDFKLRASYGLLGDDLSGDEFDDYYHPFDYMEGYDYGSGGAVLDGTYYNGAQPRGLPVTSISWLKAKILDIGIDFGLFNNKLVGSLDYFDRQRDGLPAARYDVLIPAEVGYSLPNENLNSDKTRGMDGFIKYSSNVGEFEYSVGGNFTYARMYDWHQYKPRFGNSWNEYRNSINERFGYINWGYHCVGQFQNWEEIETYDVDIDGQGNKTLRPGDLKYEDVNGDKVINGMDERPIGFRQGSTPILNFGINLALAWKNFDLALDFTGATGYTFEYNWESKNPFHDGGNNPQFYMEDQWKLSDPTDPNSELIPGKYPTLIVGNGGHSNYWNSDFWKINGRYIKLKNVEFGYNIPTPILSKVGLSKARVYTMAQNVFSIDNLNGIDPEITSGSGVQYPTNRVVSVGVNVTF
jgi:TonB-linked SusC/RagA family outer membrane protein